MHILNLHVSLLVFEHKKVWKTKICVKYWTLYKWIKNVHKFGFTLVRLAEGQWFSALDFRRITRWIHGWGRKGTALIFFF